MSIYNKHQEIHNDCWSNEPLLLSKDNDMLIVSVDEMNWKDTPDRIKRIILDSDFLPDYRYHPKNYISLLGIYNISIKTGTLNMRNGRSVRLIKVVK